jgi:hypothetical protein
MRCSILGPVLADLERIGLNESEALFATAFYSRRRLEELELQARRVDFLVRLDLMSPLDWIGGSVSPDGLLDFVRRYETRGTVRLFCSPTAHAKVYVGATGFLVGSANLTVRGFGGLASEILWLEDDVSALRAMRRTIGEYRASLRLVTIEQLEIYVQKYAEEVRVARKLLPKRLSTEDKLPRIRLPRSPRLGEYTTFLGWLKRRNDSAAQLIHARAEGQGNLSGHIRRNFFGIRQFLVAYPRTMRDLAMQDPSKYHLHTDTAVQARLKSFVNLEAADEEDFKVDTWRTYLPMSSGGKPKSGGGTIGNLKRMLPLVARFLEYRLR